MNFQSFCQNIGLAPAFAEAEQIYLSALADGTIDEPIDTWLLRDRFDVLRDTVLDIAEQIQAQPAWLRYVNLLRLSYGRIPQDQIPYLEPQKDRTLGNFAPAIALALLSRDTEINMQRRGIPEDVRRSILLSYEKILLGHEKTHGFYGVSRMLFSWAKHYLLPDTFRIGNLIFEIANTRAGEAVIALRENGEKIFLNDATVTGDGISGTILARGGEVERTVSYRREEYTPILMPDDTILSIHIPKGAKIDRASCEEAYRGARAFFGAHYPERPIAMFYCRSWLMDPALAEILPPTSNILSFQSWFQIFPSKSTGKEVFNFVHPQPFSDFSELPERTTLERGLKRRYLADNPIYIHAGYFPYNP